MPITSFSGTGAQANADIVAAVAGKAIAVTRINFTNASAIATIAITNGADAAGTRFIYGTFAVGGGVTLGPAAGPGGQLFHAVTTAGTALQMTTSAGNIAGAVEYVLL